MKQELAAEEKMYNIL